MSFVVFLWFSSFVFLFVCLFVFLSFCVVVFLAVTHSVTKGRSCNKAAKAAKNLDSSLTFYFTDRKSVRMAPYKPCLSSAKVVMYLSSGLHARPA